MKHPSPPWPTGSRRRWWPMRLEQKVEPIFHPDSYGYRPGRSAQDALARDSATLLETGLGVRS